MLDDVGVRQKYGITGLGFRYLPDKNGDYCPGLTRETIGLRTEVEKICDGTLKLRENFKFIFYPVEPSVDPIEVYPIDPARRASGVYLLGFALRSEILLQRYRPRTRRQIRRPHH